MLVLFALAALADDTWQPVTAERVKGPFQRALDAAVKAAPEGFVAERDAPVNAAVWEAKHPLPGAQSCRVTPDRWMCLWPTPKSPDAVTAVFADVQNQVARSVGPGWVYAVDPTPSAHGLRPTAYARESTTITVVPSDDRVTLTVARKAVNPAADP